MPTFKEKTDTGQAYRRLEIHDICEAVLLSIFAVSAYVFFFATAMGQNPAFAFCDCWLAPPAWPPPSSSIAAMNGRRVYRRRKSKVGRTTARSDQIRLGDGDVAAA
ncbi:hypothetical protein [Bradyrhizobium sp. WSM1743]|uniref:hypothetical protein n=1 Tax=Bradyrhizobium sp. WSM1743 TaxID=318996 RepID=UPI0018DCCAAC|nr:hypothetical protein [Bradyrhizobium sp. WSM1743]